MKQKSIIEKNRPRVSIITVNWNGWRETNECLLSLRKTDYTNCEVIVVDNASTDGSSEKIEKFFPEVCLIKNKENLGAAEGYNIGARRGLKNQADYLFFLNNDTIVKEDAISQLVYALEQERNVGLASAVVYEYFNPHKVEHYGLYADLETGFSSDARTADSPYNYLSGCALMSRSSFVMHVGLLDERYFIYGEDKDWSFRFVKKGYKLTMVDKAIVWHKHSASSGGSCSPTSLYYSIRNDRLFCEKIRKRTFKWLLRQYIANNLKVYFHYFCFKHQLRAKEIILGIFDGCIQQFGKKNTGKIKMLIVHIFTFILIHFLWLAGKIKRMFKIVINKK